MSDYKMYFVTKNGKSYT